MKRVLLVLSVVLAIVGFAHAQNYGIEFDGVTGYGLVPHSASLNVSSDNFTVEARIMCYGYGNHEPHILAKEGGYSDMTGYRLKVYYPNGNGGIVKAYFAVWADGVEYRVNSNTELEFNAWYTLTGVREGNELRLYVNGQLENTLVAAAVDLDNVGDLLIGESFVFNDSFLGGIDEVRLWDDARTSTEIASYYDVQAAGTEDHLIGLWNFDEGAGSTFSDGTAMGNDGTLFPVYTWFVIPGPYLQVVVIPESDPLVVSQGGSFEYDALVVSNLTAFQIFDLWTMVTLPSGAPYGPVWQVTDFPVGPNTTIYAADIQQNIPAFAPIGEYTFHLRAGTYPNTIDYEDQFQFEVVASTNEIGGGPADWTTTGYESVTGQGVVSSTVSSIPSEFHLAPAYPNPFNGTVGVNVTLPSAGALTVAVYDVAGRMVETLSDGFMNAGQHRLQWSPAHQASGVYFVQATFNSGSAQVQKVMYVK